MSTVDRVLSVLGLFTIERPNWTVEALAGELNLSGATAYEYVRSLVEVGLLVTETTGHYILGPAVIEMDRVTRRFDPLIKSAQFSLQTLVERLDFPAIGLLCRIYRLKVMCVEQLAVRPTSFALSYERGRPMPLERGSASKIILANLPLRTLRRFYDSRPSVVASARLGGSWDEFREVIKTIRKAGVLTTVGELDVGLRGISAPVFNDRGDVLGSISLVAEAANFRHDEELLSSVIATVKNTGQLVSLALGHEA